MQEVENENLKYKFQFIYEGIRLDSAEDLIKTYKLNKDITWDYIYDNYLKINVHDHEYNNLLFKLKNMWYDDYINPWNCKEVFSLNNQELKYMLLSMIGADAIEKEINPILVDRQSIRKKQPRYKVLGKNGHKVNKRFKNGDLKEDFVEYDDIYELYYFDKNVLNTDSNVYYVKCKDTSTNKIYYIYVNGDDDRCKYDAISAIAWTMRDYEGNPFTKEEYLSIFAEA